MSDFTLHTVESAPEAAKPILEGAQKGLGFVPNLYAGLAEAPAVLETYTKLGDLTAKTSFDATEQQTIFMTINRYHECTYCMAAHTTLSQMQKVPADVIDAIRNDTDIADEKLAALSALSLDLVVNRGWPTAAVLDKFYSVGYTKANLLELLVFIAMKTISNYGNHILETPVDAAFAPNAWSVPA